jgi:hypothetical protein
MVQGVFAECLTPRIQDRAAFMGARSLSSAAFLNLTPATFNEKSESTGGQGSQRFREKSDAGILRVDREGGARRLTLHLVLPFHLAAASPARRIFDLRPSTFTFHFQDMPLQYSSLCIILQY